MDELLDVFTKVNIKIIVFWDVTSRSLVVTDVSEERAFSFCRAGKMSKRSHLGMLAYIPGYKASRSRIYCDRFDQQVARQQLCKHSPTRNNRLGCVFYAVLAEQRWNNGIMQLASRQRFAKHVPKCNNGRCISVEEYYWSLLGNSQRTNEVAR
jgi:hypothetical protein